MTGFKSKRLAALERHSRIGVWEYLSAMLAGVGWMTAGLLLTFWLGK